MEIRLHKESGLWVREDGAVLIPACRDHTNPRLRKFHWTYGSKNNKGYMLVKFRGKNYRIHRLVAEAFIPNPEGYKEVDHYPDRNTANNAVSNLRWADRKMQSNNRQICESSLARYGVRYCDNPAAYQRALRAKNPELAERDRARGREYYAKNAKHYADKHRAYRETQKALGRQYRRCPDGSRKYLTDEEFNERYKEESTCVN